MAQSCPRQSRSAEVRCSALAMLIAPFVPWYTFPIPFVILLIGGFVYLPVSLVTGRNVIALPASHVAAETFE